MKNETISAQLVGQEKGEAPTVSTSPKKFAAEQGTLQLQINGKHLVNRVCAWCKCDLPIRPVDLDEVPNQVSHGICDDCAAVLLNPDTH